ncbi:eotaxin-like [Megalops cyprinoides]|uniref:eotaxin-like n=1 Tax=Megalops cyprinoides TaxID=118141 RepID=UPI001864FEED|nr:eotaxin-like [Megalops cyprinoides]
MAHFNLKTVCLLLVLTVTLFNLQADAACCTKYSRSEIPINLIKGYSVQTITKQCHIYAVIFLTQKGRKLCADPRKAWVMDRIQELRKRVQQIAREQRRNIDVPSPSAD